MALYALILAGGASSRFWPLSGDEYPKYLLRPDGQDTLLELAYKRAHQCTGVDNIIVVTAAAQTEAVRRALPALPTANLCIEPSRRDTAAAISFGCKVISRRDPEADVLVLPADTLLEPESALANAVLRASAAVGFESAIHVFGVKPRHAEGGFGYIDCGDPVGDGVSAVHSFVEKPGARAQELLERGFLWNVGCFLFRLTTFDRELAAHLPGHSSRLKPAEPGEVLPADYDALESISIDYGLMEKASNLRVCEVAAEFDDIGTWDALLRRGTCSQGTLAEVDATGNSAIAPGRQVAVVGASDLLVVVHGDRVLVMHKGSGQMVKQVNAAPATTPKKAPRDA